MCGGSQQQTQDPGVVTYKTGWTSFDQGATYEEDPNQHFYYGGKYYYVGPDEQIGTPGLPLADEQPENGQTFEAGKGIPDNWKEDTMAGYHASSDPYASQKSMAAAWAEMMASFQESLSAMFSGLGGSSSVSVSVPTSTTSSTSSSKSETAKEQEEQQSRAKGASATVLTSTEGLGSGASTVKTVLGA